MKTNQVVLPLLLPHLLSPSPPHHPAYLPHPVSGEHLRSVLVLDLDNSGRLDPGLAVHLDGNALVSQDGDLHRSTLIQTEMRVRWEDAHCRSRCRPCVAAHLGYAMMLQLDDSGYGHLHAPEHGHHLQDLIVKRRSAEDLHSITVQCERCVCTPLLHLKIFLSKNTKSICRDEVLWFFKMAATAGVHFYSGTLDGSFMYFTY